MARKVEEQSESVMGYFRPILMENQELLKQRSNAELFQRWLDDHPGESITSRVRNGLTNLKSTLRKELKIRRKKRRKKAGAKPAMESATIVVVSRPSRKELDSLGKLEEQIDDCLALAKHMGREALDDVIQLLRQARNEVVRKVAP
jgi:hypothetical protein